MGTARLHLTFRDLPDACIEVELAPFGVAELTRTDEDVRRDQQRVLRNRVAGVVVDRPQQAAEFVGLKDRGVVFYLGRDQSPLEEARRIARATRGGNAEAEHPAGEGATFLRRLVLACRFEAFERGEHLKRLDLLEGSFPDRANQLVEEVVGLEQRRVGPAIAGHHLVDVFPRHFFECDPRDEFSPDLLLALLERRITALRYR